MWKDLKEAYKLAKLYVKADKWVSTEVLWKKYEHLVATKLNLRDWLKVFQQTKVLYLHRSQVPKDIVVKNIDYHDDRY